MKCYCERCGGGGSITCDECEGRGTYEGGIESIKLEQGIRNYGELIELQSDAKRVIDQADRLCELKPERASSYRAQLKATLFIINHQADTAAEAET